MPSPAAPALAAVPAPVENAPKAQVQGISATIELPSKGKFYGSACPTGVIEVRPMTGREEGLVAGLENADVGEVIDELLKRCLVTPLPIDEMLATDKFYITLCLRSNSYGGFYEFKVRCPVCRIWNTSSCNVPDDFEILWYEGDGVEPFDVVLPRSKKTVGFRLLRGRDNKEIIRYRQRELEKGAGLADPAHSYAMAKSIVSIDGKAPANIGEAIKFYEDLIAMDASTLQEAIEKRSSGVNTVLDVTCSGCRTHFKTNMPFTAAFFRTQQPGA